MKTQQLGNLRVSAVGLGCMGMSHAYGEPADKKSMIELLARLSTSATLFLTRPKFTAPRKTRTKTKNTSVRRCKNTATKSFLPLNSA